MENVKNRIMRDLYTAAILGIELAKGEVTKEELEERIENLAEKFIEDNQRVAPEHESQAI